MPLFLVNWYLQVDIINNINCIIFNSYTFKINQNFLLNAIFKSIMQTIDIYKKKSITKFLI